MDHEHDQNPTHDLASPLNPRRAVLAGLGGLAAGALLSSGRAAHAGPLTPPAGPIEPTMKRLDEVEPRIPINTLPGSSNSVHRIFVPGSYYLTGDIVGEAGKSGIQVSAVIGGEVVIDLNGFAIRGVNGSFNGITCNNANPRLVIHNGQIRDWGSKGISANCRMVLEDLRVEDNGEEGAKGGDTLASQVRRCVFAGNGGDGVRVGEGSTVEQCVASENTGHGISTSSHCWVSHCDAHLNLDTGVACADYCVLRGVTSTRNTPRGILVGDGCEVTGCFSSRNSTGIEFGSSCHIYSNTCSYCDCIGFVTTGDFSVVHDNTSIQSGCLEFQIEGIRNFIVRNFAASNAGAYSVGQVGDNIFGPPVGLSTISNSNNPHSNYWVQ